jgi:uncharacterized protein
MERIDESSHDERLWAMFCHLSAFAGFLFPFGNIIGPLIIWSVKKDKYPLVDDQGKEAINFQISVIIYFLASFMLVFCLVGIPLLIAIFLFSLVLTAIASVRANEGVRYRYPLSIKFLN